MNDLEEVISDLRKDVTRAEENRRKIRKRVEIGNTHESHLEYADGVVDGLTSALALMTEKVKK